MEGQCLLSAVQPSPWGKQSAVSFSLSPEEAEQWRHIAHQYSMTDDCSVATFLLRCYQSQGSQSQGRCCQTCSAPLSQFCAMCFTLRPRQQHQTDPQTTAHSKEHYKESSTSDQSRAPSQTSKDSGASAVQMKAEAVPQRPPPSLTQITATLNLADDHGDSTNNNENSSSQFDSTEVETGVKFEGDLSSGLERGVSAEEEGAEGSSLGESVTCSGAPLWVETFRCELCPQVFTDPDLLVVHLQEHRDRMPHQCGQCKASFLHPHVLEMHAKTHSQSGKKKKYACDQCDVSMARLDNLNRHKALKHGKKNRAALPGSGCAEEGEVAEESLTSKGKFTCEHCKKGFARRDNYKRHLLTHSGEKRFGCQQCGAAFAYLNKLVTHMHLHRRQKPFQCGKCRRCFTDSASVSKHACRPAQPKHQCCLCKKTFASSSQLILHSRLHLGRNEASESVPDNEVTKPSEKNGKLYKNEIYTQSSVRTRSRTKAQTPELSSPSASESWKKSTRRGESANIPLTSITPYQPTTQEDTTEAVVEEEKRVPHEDTASGMEQNTVPQEDTAGVMQEENPVHSHPHRCQFCGAGFLFQSHLTRHLQKHTGRKAFQCPQCPTACRSPALLHIHLRSHGAGREFPCQQCSKVLKSPQALALHRRCHTGERPYRCLQCGQAFSHRALYQDHLDVHAGERRHLCPYCGKSFLRSSNLSGHIRIHTQTKKVYPCQHCGRVLRSRNTHREHMRSHTGERPFQCQQCGERFVRSGTYKTHLAKHAGVRPHLCQHCGKAFLHPCHLRVHVRVHTGEKPYKCLRCPKAFALLAGLKEHTRKHTGDRPYTCSVCGKGFAKSCNRLAHFRTHAKNGQANNVDPTLSLPQSHPPPRPPQPPLPSQLSQPPQLVQPPPPPPSHLPPPPSSSQLLPPQPLPPSKLLQPQPPPPPQLQPHPLPLSLPQLQPPPSPQLPLPQHLGPQQNLGQS